MLPAAEIKIEITDHLFCSTHSHLADCIDMVPESYCRAIYAMIIDLQGTRMRKDHIAMRVADDVALVLNGDTVHTAFFFCKDFLTASPTGA